MENVYNQQIIYKASAIQSKQKDWEFPDGPVVRTPCFHCRGHGFNPWLGN